MSHSWTHPWCKSPSRDEAVRAVEDGRSGPLPTLEEAIAAVTDRRPPEPGGGGNVTGGLRTERVTLEVTHSVPVAKWDWTNILETYRPGESVRVVEEFGTALPKVVEDMAAEINRLDSEREAAKARLSTCLAGGDAMWSRLLAVGGERDSWKILAEKSNARADSLTARVAELESQLESVACRAATAETALRQIVAQDYSRAAVNGASWKMHDIAEKALQSAPAASNSSEILTSSPAASGAAGTGWLTAEEREALTWWCGSAQPVDIGQLNDWCAAIRNLLARSSPPEVALPGQWKDAGGPGHPQVSWQPFLDTVTGRRDAEWLAALAAAGVTVKEVG